MKKGQGNSKRKTIEETLYGVRLSGEALNHVRLWSEFDSLIVLITNPFPKNEIASMKRRISELRELIFESWGKVIHQPGTLRTLAEIAERRKAISVAINLSDESPAIYPDEFAMLALYQAEKAMGITIKYRALYEHALKFSPDMTEATFSKKIKRLGIVDLQKDKSGPRPERAKRQ